MELSVGYLIISNGGVPIYNIGIPEIKVTDRLEDDQHLSRKDTAEAINRPVCPTEGCSHGFVPNRHDSTKYLFHDIKNDKIISKCPLKNLSGQGICLLSCELQLYSIRSSIRQ